MSQALKVVLGVGVVLGGLIFAHGTVNLGWFKEKAKEKVAATDGAAATEKVRETLTVAHLPVT